MTDWAAEVFSRTPTLSKKPISSYDKSASFGNLMKAGTIDDSLDKQVEFFAKQRFPNDPNALARYEVIEGKIAYKDDDGQFYLEVPNVDGFGNGMKNAAMGVSSAIAASPALATGIATAPAMLTGPAGIAYSLGMTGAAALAGNAAHEVAGNIIGGDPINPQRVVTNTALDMGGQGVAGALAKRQINKTMAGQYSDGNLMSAATNDARPLTVGQKLDNPVILGKEALARKHPASANIMQSSDDFRAAKLDDSVVNFLDSVAPQSGIPEAGIIAKDATQKAAEITAQGMAQRARPHYEAAFNSGDVVDTDPVFDFIISKVQETKGVQGKLSAEYKKVYQLMNTPAAKEGDMQALHHVKREIDEMLNTSNTDGIGKTAKAFLTDVKKTLLNQMDVNTDYKQARQIYIDLYPDRTSSESVDKIVNSIKDEKLHKVATSLLGDVNEISIKKAKDVFAIADPSGQAWSSVVRAHLEKNFIEASKEFATGNSNLRHGKFMGRVFSNAFQKANMKAALSPEQYQGMEKLMDMLKASSKGLQGESSTASFNAIREEMKGQSGNLITSATSFDFTQPGKQLFKTSQMLNEGNGWREFAEATTSPEGLKKLEQIAGLKKNSLRSKVIATHLLSFGAAETLSQDPSADQL